MAKASRLRKVMAQSVRNTGYLQKPDHSWTISSEEVLGLLMNTHFPCSSESHTVKYTQDSEVGIDSTPIDIVSESNVYWAIRSFKPFKRLPIAGTSRFNPGSISAIAELLNKLASNHP